MTGATLAAIRQMQQRSGAAAQTNPPAKSGHRTLGHNQGSAVSTLNLCVAGCLPGVQIPPRFALPPFAKGGLGGFGLLAHTHF